MNNNLNKINSLTLTLIIFDSLSVILAFLTAYFLRNNGFFRFFLDPIQPIEVYLRALPFAITLLLVVFAISGLYEPKQRITKVSEMYKSLQAVMLWTLFIMAGSYLSKYEYSRIIVIQLYFFTSFFVVFGRLIVRNLQNSFFTNGFGRINILIVGAGRPGREIARRLENYKLVGFNLVGFIDDKINDKEKVLGGLSQLNKAIKKYNVHEVYIADPALSHEKILTLVAKCPSFTTKFKITSNIFDLITGSVDIANLESIPSLDLERSSFYLWKKLYKRLFDFIFALFGLILSSPLWIGIILAIKFDSKGKTILTQDRVGQNGKLFKMYKFRTMYSETPLYKKAPDKKDDKRITKVGKFLRRTSLDELPQLINILKGEMSLVGPRPEMPFVVKKYSQWEKRRLTVKPGLTGLWQILGRKDLPLSQNLEYDFYYINNQSLFLDIVIIFKTIPLVLLGKGAY